MHPCENNKKKYQQKQTKFKIAKGSEENFSIYVLYMYIKVECIKR